MNDKISIGVQNWELTQQEAVTLRNYLTDELNKRGYETVSRVNFFVPTKEQEEIKRLTEENNYLRTLKNQER